MTTRRTPPQGFPTEGPAPELVAAGFEYECAGAAMLHEGLNLADMAHVMHLADAGIVPRAAAVALLRALLDADATGPADFGYDPADGEPYNSRERVFVEQVGDLAGWLHAGRPRREATRLAFRIYLRRHVARLAVAAAELATTLADRANEHRATLFADQTYLQQAQPSTVGHYLLSFAYPVLRDGERLIEVVRWLNASPAGAGCVNGNRLTDDRNSLADRLGFASVIENTRDAMWQVDGLIQLVSTVASLACNQTSLAEDLEIWASSEFDYVDLAESLTRASVLMPQKRNPYSLSIIRGTTGIIIGQLTGLLAVQKSPSARSDSLIFAYGEVPSVVEHGLRITHLTRAVVATLTVNERRFSEELANGFSQATDVAEQVMTECGLDYRSAYRVVGAAVRELSRAGRSLQSLTVTDLDAAALRVLDRPINMPEAALALAVDPAEIVATRTALGGAAGGPVDVMVAQVRHLAEELEREASARIAHFDEVAEMLRTRASEWAHDGQGH